MANELLPFSAETLKDYDGGRVSLALNAVLDNAVRDLVNRPGDATKRKINLVIELSPECDAAGQLESVETNVHITSKVPCFRVRPNKLTARKLRGKDVLIFHPDGNDARQSHLDFDGDES